MSELTISVGQRYAEADLISGALMLVAMVRGERNPEWAKDYDARGELVAVMESVQPTDLTTGGSTWAQMQRSWRTDKAMPNAPTWVWQWGTGLATHARKAANVVLEAAEARRTLREAREEGAQAYETLDAAVGSYR